jgi:hypothetical protein
MQFIKQCGVLPSAGLYLLVQLAMEVNKLFMYLWLHVYMCYNLPVFHLQWLATGLWFSRGTLVSSTNKTDRHDITEILLKVALNIINHQPTSFIFRSKRPFTEWGSRFHDIRSLPQCGMADRALWCLTPLSSIFQLYRGSSIA